jgi:uncharacterized protein (TIGR02118 family)
MAIAYFLHVDGPAGQHEKLQSWADQVFGPALYASGLGVRIEAYSPQSADDPYLDLDSAISKLLIVQADFAAREQLQDAMANSRVVDALAAMPGNGDFKVTAEAFTTRHFPLDDGSTPARRAPLSFVVRYYHPIENEQVFNAYYVGHHPPIMVKFPGVRNILCYLPVDWQDASGVTPSMSFLGNELVFDSVEDLNTALASDVRHDLRADYRQFPPHEGNSTHHAMLRRVLFPQ